MVAPSPGLVKLNNKDNKELLGKPEDEPPRPLPADLLDSLSVKVGDDVTEDCLHGLTQRMISTKIDLQNKQLFADQVQGAGEREVARVTSLSLPYAGAWLTCAPIPALGLHMRGPEFVVAVKFRLVMSLGIMAWCVALEGRAYRATMPCVTQSLTRQLQLALPLSKRKGPYSQAITGGLPIFSSVTGVGGRTLPWTLPSPTLSRVTPEQEQH